MRASERAEFRGFCRNATDRQLRAIYQKERTAAQLDHSDDRAQCAEIAQGEAERRGIDLSYDGAESVGDLGD